MTAPRNPSELARLEEEAAELKKEVKNLLYPKSYREGKLRELHTIEEILGVESVPYNSEEF